MIMPKMNGKEVYEEILKIRPQMCVLFMSGYSRDLIQKQGVLGKGADFLAKPVTPQNLLRKVREILDGED